MIVLGLLWVKQRLLAQIASAAFAGAAALRPAL
jgi:hypothetical protein